LYAGADVEEASAGVEHSFVDSALPGVLGTAEAKPELKRCDTAKKARARGLKDRFRSSAQ